MPKFPVYVISKGRYQNPLTAKFLLKDQTPFKIVVEPQEQEQYEAAVGKEHVLVLPFSNLGLGSIPARNWCWEHAKAAGHEWHWILDDNIQDIKRRYVGKKIRCNSGHAFEIIEQFVERYENIGIAGLNYDFFMPKNTQAPPFYLNVHVYSCMMIRNSLPYRWRGRYNEDTDLCLQVLSGGWCTILTNAFVCKKTMSMVMKGGNTSELYQGDGRLKMARSLERVWPGVVTTQRRFRRPQHVVADSWRKFDTKLKLKPDVDLSKLPAVDEFGMKLVQVASQVKSQELKALIQSQQ